MDFTTEQLAEIERQVQAAVSKATSGLVTKKEELEKKISKRNEELAAAEAAKKSDLEAAEQKRLEDEGKHGEVIELLRTQITELKEAHTAALTKLQDKFTKTDKSFRELVVDNEWTKQFMAAGVDDPDVLEAVVALHTAKAEVVEVDGKMVARIEDGSIEDYVTTWKEGKGKAFITAGSSGGGGKGSENKGGTDDFETFFKPESINLTKQNELKGVDENRYNALVAKYKQPEDTRMSVNQ